MLARKTASRYTEALFDLAQDTGKTGAWEQELAAIALVMEGSPELREVLLHPEIPFAHKETVMRRTFLGQVSTEVLALLFMLIKRGHDPDVRLLHEIYLALWNQARHILPVTVASAVALTEPQAAAIVTVLTNRTGAAIQLQRKVDPNLIAGLVVTVGDRVIDASARTALASLRESMTGM